MIERVLSNLVENAIHAIPDGGGTIELAAQQENSTVHVSISDTGVGIAQEDLSRIFDRFYRADKTQTYGTPGTGLGLAIVQKIIEAHESTISVRSTVDKGSTFSFELQAAASRVEC